MEYAVLVGHKRRALGVLLTLKTEFDKEFLPTDQLAPSALKILKDNGCVATTVQQCLDGVHAEKVHQIVQKAGCNFLFFRELCQKKKSASFCRLTCSTTQLSVPGFGPGQCQGRHGGPEDSKV